MKRTFDFVLALVALTLLVPILMLIAAAIWLADFQSPLYAGIRIACGGCEFRMLKFRSMRPEAWKSGVNSTATGDVRITRIGRVLRKFKLDELPQLINVLMGDMSLVGPRPQVPAEAGMYTAEERRLLETRPGITDLASIVFADEGEILEGSLDPDLMYNRVIRPWKSRLGLMYLDRQSMSLDFRIFGWTALALVSRRQALDSIAAALRGFGADGVTCRMAARREPLLAYPPPGADRVVEQYRSKAMTA